MNIPVTKKIVIRLVVISLFSYTTMLLVPVFATVDAIRLDIVPGILASIIIGLLILHSAERRQQLIKTVNLELNKLRRVYHLSRNLSEIDNQRYRGWFTDLHKFLYGYMMSFSDKNFYQYEETNKDFRELSYHVYKVPELRSGKEESLYDELLRTIAIVAESRQQIKEANESRLSPYAWLVILLLLVGVIISTWLSTADLEISRIAAGTVIAVFMFAVDLLWEVDTLSSESRSIAKRYVENISRIEMRRRKDE